jgi:hypothetical protein
MILSNYVSLHIYRNIEEYIYRSLIIFQFLFVLYVVRYLFVCLFEQYHNLNHVYIWHKISKQFFEV